MFSFWVDSTLINTFMNLYAQTKPQTKLKGRTNLLGNPNLRDRNMGVLVQSISTFKIPLTHTHFTTSNLLINLLKLLIHFCNLLKSPLSQSPILKYYAINSLQLISIEFVFINFPVSKIELIHYLSRYSTLIS